ncbi:MAG TPA: hypothetical protein VFO65_00395, partial [Acidimicrobiales bacterium]|nr:hypothetical protein [Acidimicrobiales bacterium]
MAGAVLWSAGPPESLASFGDGGGAHASSSFGAAVLAPPTNLVATPGCNLLQPKVTLSWTPSASAWADGQEVGRAASAGGTLTIVASGLAPSATGHTATGLATNPTD